MTSRRLSLSLSLVLLCSALSACELIADFDRGKLTPPEVDSGSSTVVDDDDAGSDAGAQKSPN